MNSIPWFSKLTFLTKLTLVQKALLISSCTAITYQALRCFCKISHKRRLIKKVNQRTCERQETINNLKTLLDTGDEAILERRQWIINLEIQALIAHLQEEKLTAVEVLEAFQWSALQAQEKTNCVTQFIAEAREWSQRLDMEYRNKAEKPPLFGLPFSVKESTGVKNYDTTAGYAQLVNCPCKNDSVVVSALRQLGAVPFVLTNVPQTLLALNCCNLVYGTTNHPLDTKRTCGGSSGGEAALTALNGSVFGIGSDVAGSIRIPSHFCGIAGLKPCSSRISQIGAISSTPGRAFVQASYGPMARDVDTLAVLMECILSRPLFEQDYYVAPMPFRKNMYNGKEKKQLTIGYYVNDGFVEAAPACARAVKMAKQILEADGHKLVPFQPPDIDHALEITTKAAITDGGRYLHEMLRNDLLHPTLVDTARLWSLPFVVRRALGKCLSWFKNTEKLGLLVASFPMSTWELRQTYAAIVGYRLKFMAAWSEQSLDAVICPPNASVAVPHEYATKLIGAIFYTVLYNMLDFCGGVVPVTKVTTEDEQLTKTSYRGVEFYTKNVKKVNSDGTVGMPVGVQIATPPYMEEVCLRVMKILENGAKNK